MTYLHYYAEIEHPTGGLSSKDLIPLVNKYKNVNLFSYRGFFSVDCEGNEMCNYRFVFGARDKRSAMSVFMQAYFSNIFHNVKKYLDGTKKIPFSTYLKKNYGFGEKLVWAIRRFKRQRQDFYIGLTSEFNAEFNDSLIMEFFSEIFAKWDEKVGLWRYIVEQYDFGADLISEIIEQYDFGVELTSAISENYIDWIKQWFKENPFYFNRKEILFYRGKIPDREFRKEEIFLRMINHPSYIMVENIARNYPDSPLGNLWNSITVNQVKTFLSQILEQWNKRPQIYDVFTLMYPFEKYLILNAEKFWGTPNGSITIKQIKSYLYQNANSLISDETDFLFEMGQDEHSSWEEKDLLKVVNYFKQKYPREYNRQCLYKKHHEEELVKYRRLDTFF